jgi:hypothetical protein
MRPEAGNSEDVGRMTQLDEILSGREQYFRNGGEFMHVMDVVF